MSKLPALQFYPGDWLKDDISGCSLAAQGLWLRMMFVMHESSRYGYLAKDGVAIPAESIARRCGCTLQEYNTLVAELEQNGVPSRTPDGILFCRRMVRDAALRSKNARRIKKFREEKRSCNASVTHDEKSHKCSTVGDLQENENACNALVTPMKRSCNADVAHVVTPLKRFCNVDVQRPSSSSSSSSSISLNDHDGEKSEPFDIPLAEASIPHEAEPETLADFLISDEVSKLAQEMEQIDARLVSRQTVNWLPEALKQVDRDFVLKILKSFLKNGGGDSNRFKSYLNVCIGTHLAKKIGVSSGKHQQSSRRYASADTQQGKFDNIGVSVNAD